MTSNTSNAKPESRGEIPSRWARRCFGPTTRFGGATCILLCIAGGCAAVPLATIGTVAGITSSALITGREVFTLGKLDTVEMAWYPATVVAVRRAADDLQLRPKGKEELKDFEADLAFVDEKGANLWVHVDRRTDTLVRLRIDVGLFGSEVTARLFLSRLRFHVPGGGNPGETSVIEDVTPFSHQPSRAVTTTGPTTRPDIPGSN